MPYTDVFGGANIYPSEISYSSVTLTTDIYLSWPEETSANTNLATRIMDVTPNAAGRSLFLPDASKAGTGETILFNNLGTDTFTVRNSEGVQVVTVASGTLWQIYLTDNSTAAGQWESLQYGASISQANASALAGTGIVAVGALLSQSVPITGFNANYTSAAADRAKMFNWTGAGGTLTLPDPTVVGNNWFIYLRNSGSGAIVADAPGFTSIDGSPFVSFQPGDSAIIASDGSNFYTIGFGQSATFAFDYTVIDVPGTGDYVLSGTELNRVSYRFTGILSGNRKIVVPATVQQYWIDNQTTGAYTFTIQSASVGASVALASGERAIMYCDGVDVVRADTYGVSYPIAVNQGGTGATNSGAALINLGGTATGIGLFTAASAAAARSALSAAAAGANSDITSLSGLTTPLSRAQGGTGTGSAPTNGQLLIGNGTGYTLANLTAGAGISISNSSGGITITNAASGFDPSVNNTFTGRQTFTGSTTALAAVFNNIAETATVSATAASGTIAFDVTTQSVVYYTSNASGNWTINLRGNGTTSLNTLLSTGQAVTVAFLATNGGTPYYNSSVQVDGTTSGVTTRWQGGTAPSAGNASSIDVYTYTIIKTGSAAFTVLASQTKY